MGGAPIRLRPEGKPHMVALVPPPPLSIIKKRKEKRMRSCMVSFDIFLSEIFNGQNLDTFC